MSTPNVTQEDDMKDSINDKVKLVVSDSRRLQDIMAIKENTKKIKLLTDKLEAIISDPPREQSG